MKSRLIYLAFCFAMAFCPVLKADFITGNGTFTNGNILDAPDNVVMSTITIVDSGTVEDITVTIRGLSHTNVGDLIAELRFLGDGGPSGPGGEPAHLFFRPNVDDQNFLGSRSNFNGTYSFGSTGANLWTESAIGDNEDVPEQQFVTSDEDGLPHDLGGPEFFEGLDIQGDWQLVITDANEFGTNEGFVEAWTIEIETTGAAIPEPASTMLISTLLAVTAVRRRR